MTCSELKDIIKDVIRENNLEQLSISIISDCLNENCIINESRLDELKQKRQQIMSDVQKTDHKMKEIIIETEKMAEECATVANYKNKPADEVKKAADDLFGKDKHPFGIKKNDKNLSKNQKIALAIGIPAFLSVVAVALYKYKKSKEKEKKD